MDSEYSFQLNCFAIEWNSMNRQTLLLNFISFPVHSFNPINSAFISLAKAIMKRHDPTGKLTTHEQFAATKKLGNNSREKANKYPNGVLQSNGNLG